jgi:hypothetical protein
MNLTKKFSIIFEWTFEKKKFDVFNCFFSIVRLFFFQEIEKIFEINEKSEKN